MFFELAKDFGDRMALAETKSGEAVLILTEREETAGPFFTVASNPHQYPIIKFEQPPELCGVGEPTDEKTRAKLHAELHSKFLQSLTTACKEHRISVVYCAGTENKNALPYREVLALAGITLKEYAA